MRSSLFQQPSLNLLLNQVLMQFKGRGKWRSICTTTLKTVLQRLSHSTDLEINNSARHLLNCLIEERVYILQNDKLLPLCFDIPIENNPLANQIESVLTQINHKLYPDSVRVLNFFPML